MFHMLIIDDDKTLSSMLGNLVGHPGHQVTSSFTITEELAKGAAKPYDVVFLPVQPPRAMARRASPKATASAPGVVIMTAKATGMAPKLP